MEKVKQSSVAGVFYTDNPVEFKKQIEYFQKENDYSQVPAGFSTRAVIVPHAGLVYSGVLAYRGLDYLDRKVKTIYIFAPAHREFFKGISLTTYDFWQTPFGKIPVDTKKVWELKEKFGAVFEINFNDEPYKNEHSIEIQLPLLQAMFEDFKIVPVLIGKQTPKAIETIIDANYPNSANGFVISSDLSHYLTDTEAKKLDLMTAGMIEDGKAFEISSTQACGHIGISGLTSFAKKNKFTMLRAGLMNSSAVTGDKNHVVGYGAWTLFEGEKNEFIKKYYSKFVLELCYASIKTAFSKNDIEIKYNKVFDEYGACFVTIEEEGVLRGCIGSIKPHRNLIVDLIANAKAAAFSDPRFRPLAESELDKIKISVSLLSEMEKINFLNEEDLLNKIEQGKDGILIKDEDFQAVYLPSVWKQIPEKRDFLNSLKVKAGLSQDHFSNTFCAYKFSSTYINEEDCAFRMY